MPDTIYHIADPAGWPPGNGAYTPDSFAAEGFVHASSWSQLQGVASSLFAGRTDIIVLEIDTTLLPAAPVWEDLYDLGQDFPHLYSHIPDHAVIDTLDVTWDDTGAPWFRLGSGDGAAAWRAIADPEEADVRLLARLNGQLIEDEGHDCPLDRTGLEARMVNFLASSYSAFLLSIGDEAGGNRPAGYALVDLGTDRPHLRQFFIRRGLRRQHLGTRAFEGLRNELGAAEMSVDVLSSNDRAIRFWHSVGFSDRSVTMQFGGRSHRNRGDGSGPA